MKILIASDIHGNNEAFNKAIDFFLSEGIDKIILLGDLLASPFYPSETDKQIINTINYLADKIVICEGNCDFGRLDNLLMINPKEYHEQVLSKYRMICFHGHKRAPYYMNADIYVTGHSHCVKLLKRDGKIYLNPGSIGRPRDFTCGSFLVISEHTATIFDLNYQVVMEDTLLI